MLIIAPASCTAQVLSLRRLIRHCDELSLLGNLVSKANQYGAQYNASKKRQIKPLVYKHSMPG